MKFYFSSFWTKTEFYNFSFGYHYGVLSDNVKLMQNCLSFVSKKIRYLNVLFGHKPGNKTLVFVHTVVLVAYYHMVIYNYLYVLFVFTCTYMLFGDLDYTHDVTVVVYWGWDKECFLF